MNRKLYIFTLICILMISCGNAAEVRKSAVAGQFYPADAAALKAEVKAYLSKAPQQKVTGRPTAFLVPHAGYVYSARTAAYAYKLLSSMEVRNVILIGNSHHSGLSKGAVFASGSFRTPLGTVRVNEELARRIIGSGQLFEDNRAPHYPEHSIEVQLPFLIETLRDFSIVPILLGSFSPDECRKAGRAVAEAVKSLGLEGTTVIIASSDMSHYPSWANAKMADGAALKAIEKFDPAALEKTSADLMASRVPGLACVLCGLESTCLTMHAAKALGADKAKILHYENSGDITNDRSRVVGYGAAVFLNTGLSSAKNTAKTEKKMSDFTVSDKNQKELLKAARLSIENYLRDKKISNFKSSDPELLTPAAVFVTLTVNGNLRGCIGNTEPHAPLYEAVGQMAIAAAFEDYRFSPMTPAELPNTRIEISVLSPMARVSGADEIKQGVHGVVVRRGMRSGLFLPQVWEHFEKKEDFLNELCWQKAGIDPGAWKDPKTELYTFTVFSFEEPK